LQRASQLVQRSNGTSVSNSAETIPQLVAASANSVVTISVISERRVVQTLEGDLFGLSSFISIDGERTEKVQQDAGTGFVVDGGFIITNRHVVAEENAEYSVIDQFEREFMVTRVYRDPSNDIAILKIEKGSLQALPLGDSDQLVIGEQVLAIGTVLGEFRHTVTSGIISGLGRGIVAKEGIDIQALDGVIQTDAVINPGNSGGPLLNANGQVIGVAVARSSTGEGIGFALPINIVKASIENFLATGQFDRPFLGVQYRMLSLQAAEFNEVPVGAYILEVLPNGSAAAVGLQAEDIIVELDGKKITEDINLAELINSKKIGQTVSIIYWRNGEVITSELAL
jgi:serine protease Do